ncbi:ejaculatory bulb-specific protein 3-like [Epargyreus clarus]|uniref:ejaculatory bulb-specific protein 3-like n=1 Tax=Epargyreus clarus TaxID=520877 RepID=UPI003C2C7FF7
MKFVILFAMVSLAAAQFYVTEDDYVDIDAVIADLPSLQSYSDCFLDRGPCTSLTQSFKDVIPDAVRRACDRCNVPQKQRFGRFLQGLQARLREDYELFRQKYDPMNIYFDALEAELSQFWDYVVPEQRPEA